MDFIHWKNKLICQNGIRYMSEECQNTIRCLLIVQIVLIWYWSQFTTGVISLDSFYEDSIFWSLYIAESEHKDSLNRGFITIIRYACFEFEFTDVGSMYLALYSLMQATISKNNCKSIKASWYNYILLFIWIHAQNVI